VTHVAVHEATNDGWYAVDLRDALWQPVRDLFSGHNPYDAPAYVARHQGGAEFDLYAPGWLLIAAPIAALPWQVAIVSWSGIAQVMAGALAIATCRIARLPKIVWMLPAVLLLILRCYPEYVAQLGANPSLLVAPVAAVALWRAKDDKVTAVALAIALIKPQFGLPIAAVLLATGCWRSVLRAVALVAIVSAVPLGLAIAHAGGVVDFMKSLGRNLDYASSSPASGVIHSDLRRVDVAALISHANNAYLSTAPTLGIAIVLIGVACWTYRRYSDLHWPSRVRSYAIASAATILALPHGRYDLVFLAPPTAALLHLALLKIHHTLDRYAAVVAILTLGFMTLAPNRLLAVVGLGHGTNNVVVCSLGVVAVGALLVIDRLRNDRSTEGAGAPPEG
jgi:hypothetical protein